jgi:3'-phosphoadenosine 5'-phosphosulfate sulfotransferase (PAPS reductase)/FAD synthetase
VTTPLVAISLGWGVQSMTLAAMSALGDLPSVDVAIHADTTHERSATYAYAQRWTPWLETRGVRVVTVHPKAAEPIDRFGGMMLPGYTVTPKGDGHMSRQCTDNWKRAPLRRWLQANRWGIKSEQRGDHLVYDAKPSRLPVEQWLGISMDEWQRAKDSDVKYVTNRFPLLEKRMTRNDCANYLERHDIEVPSKSACVFCPFHNMRAWVEMKAEGGSDWQKAVEVDEAIRKARPPYDLFLHRAMIPLVDVDLRTPEDKGQMALWQEACESGYCWT